MTRAFAIMATPQRPGPGGAAHQTGGGGGLNRIRAPFCRSNSPSHMATTTMATALPQRLVTERASDMKRSTPSSNAMPATGMCPTVASVAARVMNPPPVTAFEPPERIFL